VGPADEIFVATAAAHKKITLEDEIGDIAKRSFAVERASSQRLLSGGVPFQVPAHAHCPMPMGQVSRFQVTFLLPFFITSVYVVTLVVYADPV
jgi:hypothetical protein